MSVKMWFEGILALVALVAWYFCITNSRKGKNEKVSKWIACLATIALMVIDVIIDPIPTIIAKACVFLSFIYAFSANGKRSILELAAIPIITSIAIFYALQSYEANFRPADGGTILSENIIAIQSIDDRITVTKTTGSYNYIEKLENGGVSFESIPDYRTKVIYTENINDSHIKLSVKKNIIMNYNSNPPEISYIDIDNWYELYVPEWSIYDDDDWPESR